MARPRKQPTNIRETKYTIPKVIMNWTFLSQRDIACHEDHAKKVRIDMRRAGHHLTTRLSVGNYQKFLSVTRGMSLTEIFDHLKIKQELKK